jgi:hypothetical protein
MDGKDKLAAFGIGALGGGVVAFLGWSFFSSQVNQQVDATVRSAVDSEVARKLADAGLTPQIVANLRTVIDGLDRAGVFSTLASGASTLGTRGRR